MRLIFLLSLIFIVITAWLSNNVNNTLNHNHDCNLSLEICEILLDGQNFSIEFEQKPVVEEELYIKFVIPTGWVIENAWIEGVNMYMGKTPVMFESPDNLSQGITFLGSCNLAEMNWIMYVKVDQKGSTNSHLLALPFTTYL